MFLRLTFIAFLLVLQSARALTVRTLTHGDWENPAVWSGAQVPASPDTILVRHYMVINQNLTIGAPCVLIVEQTGTICGDYLLETLCGASFVNKGHMYLNRITTRHGINYRVIACKNNIMISGCSSPTPGFYSVPPDGSVKVWPPVLCKTPDTNWEGGTSTGMEEWENRRFRIYPNPLGREDLFLVADTQTTYTLTDVTGCLIASGSFKDRHAVNSCNLPPGLYLLTLESGGIRQTEKILKTD